MNICNLIVGFEGLTLYSPLIGVCVFDHIRSEYAHSYIYCTYKMCGERRMARFNENGNYCGTLKRDDENGLFYDDVVSPECLLFPSSEQRDWNKFVKPRKPLKENEIVLYKKYESDSEWKLGFYVDEGQVSYKKFEGQKGLQPILNVEVIVKMDKLDMNDLSYSPSDNYGINHYK